MAKCCAIDGKWPTAVVYIVHSFYAVDEVDDDDKTLDVDTTNDLRWTLVYADGFCVTKIPSERGEIARDVRALGQSREPYRQVYVWNFAEQGKGGAIE